jgi:hypothetical protein
MSLGCTSYAAAVPTPAGPTPEAQLQELKQLVSMLLGAESVDDMMGESSGNPCAHAAASHSHACH